MEDCCLQPIPTQPALHTRANHQLPKHQIIRLTHHVREISFLGAGVNVPWKDLGVMVL